MNDNTEDPVFTERAYSFALRIGDLCNEMIAKDALTKAETVLALMFIASSGVKKSAEAERQISKLFREMMRSHRVNHANGKIQ